MHLVGIAAIIVNDVLSGDALAEVGLERVNAHLAECAQLALVPLACSGVSEVNDSHAGLPHVALPYASVLGLEEVAALHALVEHGGALRDVGVDPDADLKPLCLQSVQHSLGVREHSLVPCEVAPVEFLHPEAVEVEYLERDIALRHAVDEAGNCSLVVVGGEGCSQPQTECVSRSEGGLAGQGGVGGNNVGQLPAADNEILKVLALNRESYLGNGLACDLERYLLGVVNEHAVVSGRNVERNGLVALLGACAAVVVPYLDSLTFLYECGELLAEAVQALAYGYVEHLAHYSAVSSLVMGEERLHLIVCHALVGLPLILGDIGRGAPAFLGEQLVVVVVLDVPCAALCDNYLSIAGNKLVCAVGLLDDGSEALVLVELEIGRLMYSSLVVVDGHLDGVLQCGSEGYLKHRTAQGHASVAYPLVGGKYVDRGLICCYLVHLGSVVHAVTGLVQP